VKTFQGDGKFAQAKITNSATGGVYVVPITNAQAVFWLNMITCEPGGVFAADSVAGTTPTINLWSNDPTLTGNIVVDMVSGSIAMGTGYAWVGVQYMYASGPLPYLPVYGQNITSAKFTIKGYQLDDTTAVISDVKVVYL
jgi:hypothetical protein